MLHKTKGIVLKTVKFGETSLVVTFFTALFGLQTYMVNGVRALSKKGTAKGAYFQSGAILELVVYHNEFKNLQRIKEFRWSHLYDHIFSDVFKNAVALYLIELVSKLVKEPEPNIDLFNFIEDALLNLDRAGKTVTANFPLFVALHLAVFSGFRIRDNYSEDCNFLDLQEGLFIEKQPNHSFYMEGKEAEAVSHTLKILHPQDLEYLKLNQEQRRRLLNALETYYALHIADFGSMKTLPVLREISG